METKLSIKKGPKKYVKNSTSKVQKIQHQVSQESNRTSNEQNMLKDLTDDKEVSRKRNSQK